MILQILCEAVVITLCGDNMTVSSEMVANSVSGVRGMSDICCKDWVRDYNFEESQRCVGVQGKNCFFNSKPSIF